ncbi:MAG: hypothetical protein GXP25_15180 [Planctomycetes bacterium]|nr:hypothetical protein [Planctomycetota bacterium]
MKRVSILLLLAFVTIGCQGKKKEKKQEPVGEMMGGKPVMVELVTGDVLRLEFMMEEPDALLLKGSAGTGRFPKVLIRRVSDAPAERPSMDLPGKDLLRQRRTIRFRAKVGGRTFHTLNCRLVRNLKRSERIDFETRKEALNRGFRPCGMCNP